jgi:hypothetical protein
LYLRLIDAKPLNFGIMMNKIGRREALKITGKAMIIGCMPPFSWQAGEKMIRLSEVRQHVNDHFRTLLPEGKPYGSYQTGKSIETDLYASCDVAIARHIMGEKLSETLSHEQREEWIQYINTYQQPEDGSYTNRLKNHSKLHANGMTIGALGVLHGKQRYRVRLYEDFNTREKVIPWLEQIDWANQWGASHHFWGGIHCYSMSRECSEDWLSTVFDWLDSNLDPSTGWWRRGVEHTDRNQALGGSVHILPVYQHHDRAFPFPRMVIDSVLALQLPDGTWQARNKDQVNIMNYLELDALYAMNFMLELAPGYRIRDIEKAVSLYADLVCAYWNHPDEHWKTQHPHGILAIVGIFGLMQKFLPERFVDSIQWSDIFSDIRLYNTAAVEAT